MTARYEQLHVTSLTPERYNRTCGYWYTVTNGAYAHTAFRTREALNAWLADRFLTLASELPAQGEWGTSEILGAYNAESHYPDTFGQLVGFVRPEMSNGEYTVAIITEARDGERTVHTLNPNALRPVYDAAKARRFQDSGWAAFEGLSDAMQGFTRRASLAPVEG